MNLKILNRRRSLVFIFSFFFILNVFGVQLSQAEFESYSVRPNISTLSEGAHGESLIHDLSWNSLKRAHLEAIAQIVEMYPESEIYFLARDSELLFDFARLATKDEPLLVKRLHLINISRANMNQDGVKEYLAQEGITDAELLNRRKFLFVDTGFSGTIPRTISEKFPEFLRSQFKSHLMASSNRNHPSSRVFLTALNPLASESLPSSMHGTILAYEQMPRYTDRSHRFENIEGVWHPMSWIGGATDGVVHRAMAEAYMRDLKLYSEQPDTQELFQRRRATWRKLRIALESKNKLRMGAELEAVLNDPTPYGEAIVRDFLELVQCNSKEFAAYLPSLEDLGLSEIFQAFEPNKYDVIEKNPDWKGILENPEAGVRTLVQYQDFHTLRAILDVLVDYEFTSLAAKELLRSTPGADSKTIKNIELTVAAMLDLGHHGPALLDSTFAQVDSHSSKVWEAILMNHIGKQEPNFLKLKSFFELFNRIPEGVFPSAREKLKDHARLMIQNNDDQVLLFFLTKVLASHTFSDWIDLRNLLRIRIHQILSDASRPIDEIVVQIFLNPISIAWSEERELLRNRIPKMLEGASEQFNVVLIQLLSKEFARNWLDVHVAALHNIELVFARDGIPEHLEDWAYYLVELSEALARGLASVGWLERRVDWLELQARLDQMIELKLNRGRGDDLEYLLYAFFPSYDVMGADWTPEELEREMELRTRQLKKWSKKILDAIEKSESEEHRVPLLQELALFLFPPEKYPGLAEERRDFLEVMRRVTQEPPADAGRSI